MTPHIHSWEIAGAGEAAKEIGDRTHSSAAVRITVGFINVEGGGISGAGSFS